MGRMTPPSGTYPGRGGKDGRAVPARRIWSGQPFCRALYQPTLPQMWYKPCPTCFPCRPAPFKQKGKDAEHQAILPNGKIGGKSYGICTHICISATRSTNFSHFRMYTPPSIPPLSESLGQDLLLLHINLTCLFQVFPVHSFFLLSFHVFF